MTDLHTHRPRPLTRSRPGRSRHAGRLRALAAALALAATAARADTGTSAPATPATPATPASQPTAGVPMRLPADVVPQSVQLHLIVDPAQARHRGEVVIAIDLQRPLPADGTVRLHARGLALQDIWLERDGQRWPGQAEQIDPERVALRFGTALPAGPARLSIGFAGAISERETYGLFRQQDGGQWAAFTQFEATGARRAFPLFDEPGWKIPFTLSVTVPEDLQAFSNMPVASDAPAGSGQRRVTFQTTPPIPSYLLALGVGRFDVVDGGKAGRQGVPVRFIVPPGQGGSAAYAARITPRIVDALETWFDMPYPYAKLDSMVQPVTSGYGAMEHPGLITYASWLLLAPPGEQSPGFERRHASIAAHELAHQWFGNLVTMAWWDDLWLNESFASWMAEKIANQVQPDWPWRHGLQRARSEAMRADRLASARHVEQPILRDADISNQGLFDTITYQKGQAVLSMFEAWTGPEAFRDGVRRYLRQHAGGNATSADFFRSLAGTDPALPAAVRSFTRQGGVPRLQVRLVCGDGPPRLQLAQSRLLSVGAAATAPQVWQLPLRVRTPGGTRRLLMTTPEATLPLPDAGCPAWVQANADGSGYWRTAYAGDGLQRLAAAPDQSAAEWLALLDDAGGLHDAGDIDNRQALALARAGAARPEGEVQWAAASLLWQLHPLADLGRDADRRAYASAWQDAFGARARALGWLPTAGDSADDRQLRPRLVPMVALAGEDAALRRSALALARGWLADRTSLPAEVREAVLASAARADGPGSGEALFDALLDTLRGGSNRTERYALLSALGQFRQPALAERARALLLDPAIDPRESLWPLLRAHNDDPVTRNATLDFLVRERAALAARLNDTLLAAMPRQLGGGCSDADARRIRDGFEAGAATVPGGALGLARTLETVRLCAAWAARQGSRFD